MSLYTVDKTQVQNETTQQQSKPKDNTAQKLYELMTESTGASILDSGGAGTAGRAWEKNQVNNFDEWPAAFFSFEDDGKIEQLTGSLYQILCEHLEFEDEWTQKYIKFDEDEDPDHRAVWINTMEKFAEQLDEDYRSDNTYNLENSLTGDIQYVSFEDPDSGERIYLIQHHGGADARGGYTAPMAFTAKDDDCFQGALMDLFASCECTSIDLRGPYLTDPNGSCTDELNEWPSAWVKDKTRPGAAFCTGCNGSVDADISRY